ncbi:MAG: trypsin-like peptidase domain-containing protein [Phycisphaerales bacterium]
MRRLDRVLVAGLVGATLWLSTPGAIAQDEAFSAQAESDIAFAKRLSNAFKHASREIESSVVHITSARLVQPVRRDRFGRRFAAGEPQLEPTGLGSGVIVDSRGYVLTNNHVVDGAQSFIVRLADGREFPAEVVGQDPPSDLAVLHFEGEGFSVAQFGDSEALEVGEWVIAVGSPFGIDNTVTAGIVSAKGRTPRDIMAPEDEETLQEFIQTDAAINPGNSGGPLVNLEGKVIGINTAIASRSGGSIGLGFAIPSEIAKVVMSGIIEHGYVPRGWLGISATDIKPERFRELGLERAEGAIVTRVQPDSPADKAGLRAGDVVTEFGGRRVNNWNRFRNLIAITPPNTRNAIVYFRDGKRLEGNVVLADRFLEVADQLGGSLLGLDVEPAGIDLTAGHDGGVDQPGLVVEGVVPGSLAAQCGFMAGDVITGAGGASVHTLDDLTRALRAGDLTSGIRVDVTRGDRQGYIDLGLDR